MVNGAALANETTTNLMLPCPSFACVYECDAEVRLDVRGCSAAENPHSAAFTTPLGRELDEIRGPRTCSYTTYREGATFGDAQFSRALVNFRPRPSGWAGSSILLPSDSSLISSCASLDPPPSHKTADRRRLHRAASN